MDAHYTLWSSSDIDHLGPDVIVMAEATPIGDYNPNDAGSMWVAPVLNPAAAVRGPYTYRTMFLVDSAETAGAALAGTILSAAPTEVLLNGEATGFVNSATAFPGPHRLSFSFTITDGFVAGLNTLDFVVDNTDGLPNSQGYNALRVMSLRGIGNALPEGLPTVNGPASQTVREGGKVTFAPVARGRPPLTYQWLADGVPLLDATNRVLKFNPVFPGAQGSSFQVVVQNDSGSVTSAAATLTILVANQPITATDVNVTGVKGAPVRIPVSLLVQNASDPDGDLIALGTVDATGTNTVSPARIMGLACAGSETGAPDRSLAGRN